MDKWKYTARWDSKWGNSFKDGSNPYQLKDEGESLEMAWSYSKENAQCTGKKEKVEEDRKSHK